MTSIKFCGLTRATDAAWAATLGAAYAGVIFAPDSRRRVTQDQARMIFDSVADTVEKVGVFGDTAVAEIAAMAEVTGLDVIQMHGNPTIEGVRELRSLFRGRIWAVTGVMLRSGFIGQATHDLAAEVDAILLDTTVDGLTGGAGVAFDWEALADDARRLSSRTPIVVAGGLSPGNVAEAIRLLCPATVDVSSGVEVSPGIKDHALMRSFAEAVRSAS